MLTYVSNYCRFNYLKCLLAIAGLPVETVTQLCQMQS